MESDNLSHESMCMNAENETLCCCCCILHKHAYITIVYNAHFEHKLISVQVISTPILLLCLQNFIVSPEAVRVETLYEDMACIFTMAPFSIALHRIAWYEHFHSDSSGFVILLVWAPDFDFGALALDRSAWYIRFLQRNHALRERERRDKFTDE